MTSPGTTPVLGGLFRTCLTDKIRRIYSDKGKFSCDASVDSSLSNSGGKSRLMLILALQPAWNSRSMVADVPTIWVVSEQAKEARTKLRQWLQGANASASFLHYLTRLLALSRLLKNFH